MPIRALQWYLADMATKTEAAKALTLNAAALRQAGKNITKEVAMAKYYASETAVEVANKALQIHGGYGYMKRVCNRETVQRCTYYSDL
ncbi:MAG: acyl-CoA dehydrogenase family protein [Coprococcus sp.]